MQEIETDSEIVNNLVQHNKILRSLANKKDSKSDSSNLKENITPKRYLVTKVTSQSKNFKIFKNLTAKLDVH